MKPKETLLFNRFTFIFGVISTGFLLYNMLAMHLYKEQLFGISQVISSVGVIILAGFALVFLFDISSLGWIVSQFINKASHATAGLKLTLVFGGFCLFLLMVAKVMIDEVGREYVLGRGGGEWIILYIALTIQGIYNLVVLLQLYYAHRMLKA